MLRRPHPPNTLWCTRCCPVKAVRHGRPDQLYGSPSLAPFFRFVRGARRFGVLSDLYGLHLDIEVLGAYDVHPSSLTDERKRELGAMVRAKCEAHGFATIIFYNNSPIMSLPYFEMLGASGVPVWYTTRLPS